MANLCGFNFAFLLLLVRGTSCVPIYPETQKNLTSHRTPRELSCNTDEYAYEDWCCEKCPAGFYVTKHCTGDHQRSSCDSCTLGQDFTNSANGLEQCLSCGVCRQDEVLVHPCTLTSKAVCQCKRGTYCTEGLCEICIPCSRCNKGKREKEPCSPTKNTVCEDIPQTQPTSNTTRTYLLPPTSTKDTTTAPKIDVTKDINSTHERDVTKDSEGSSTETNSFFIPFIITLVIIAVLIVAVGLGGWPLYKFCKMENRNPSNTQNLLNSSSADPSTNSSLTSLPLEDKANQGVAAEARMEAQPLLTSRNVLWNCVTEPTIPSSIEETQTDADPGGDDHGGGGKRDTNCNEPCSTCEQYQPCECYWTDCFHCVIDVCPQHIVRIVRELHVPNSKIDCIIKDIPNDSYEQGYKLLQLWRTIEGKQASMNNIINVLINNMEMPGLAENIKNLLRSKNTTIV